MPQSVTKIWIHVVFSTKNRWPFLDTPEIRDEMFAYLGGACAKMNAPTIIVGGVADHVHILCQLGKNSVSTLLGGIKKTSSKWIKGKGGALSKFYWQNGYGAFSIGQSQLPAVKNYIQTQEIHHQKEGFKDEFRKLLKLYDVQYDEEFIWD